jgi:hypothetical protein
VPNSAGQAVPLGPAGQAIIYTANLTVRAPKITQAAALARQIATSAGGYVSSENTSVNPGHPASSTVSLELKIPATAYQATLSQLAGQLGTQTALSQQAQDVTEQVADVGSRVASDQAAIAQLRALLAHAGSVSDLLSVQDQINSEESDLESMQAQQRALDHETAYATVSLTLVSPAPRPAPHKAKPGPGLGGGIVAGWRGLRLTVSWLIIALGAAAPFAAVGGLAVYLAYRVRRRTQRPSA